MAGEDGWAHLYTNRFVFKNIFYVLKYYLLETNKPVCVQIGRLPHWRRWALNFLRVRQLRQMNLYAILTRLTRESDYGAGCRKGCMWDGLLLKTPDSSIHTLLCSFIHFHSHSTLSHKWKEWLAPAREDIYMKSEDIQTTNIQTFTHVIVLCHLKHQQ